MWIQEKKRIRFSYTPAPGSFGYQSNEGWMVDEDHVIDVWHSCREGFLAMQAGRRAFYFKHDLPAGLGRSVAEFIDKIEAKLGIKSVRRTKVQATSKRSIVNLMISPFWDQSDMRRSLFTALLRASVAYRMSANEGAGNLEEAIYSYPYTRLTRPAVERFIEQRATHYRGSAIGWHSAFSGKTPIEIDRLLTKTPKRNKPRPQATGVPISA